jgi:uncharacterized protein YbbC (DUF1343 family)
MAPASPGIVPGLEVLLRDRRDLIAGRRVGLLANQGSVTRDLVSGVDLLHAGAGVQLVALFGPEHGLQGAAQAGEAVAAATDQRTGLPVYSLYGETRAPTPEMLADLDVLLFDVQDSGARYFTYPSTLLLVLRAAAVGLKVVVLDRPNPLGGRAVQGNVLDPAFTSFVGAHPVAIRHGLTLGELALLMNDEAGIGADLAVVPAAGWRRSQWYDETGLPWVPPSPNLPHLAAVALYPGTCLLEGTNVSEGRGTTQPFELCGAPWIDGERLRALLAERLPAAVRPRRCVFVPAFSKYAGQVCEGVALHVFDRAALDPVAVGVQLLFALRDLYPEQLAVSPPAPGAARPFLDLLAGSDALRVTLQAGAGPAALLERWNADAATFAGRRRAYLLY